MTETAHTPGPWRFLGPQPYDGGSGGIIMAGDIGIGSVFSGPEWEANAHLIAAAPDMLAALKVYDAYERYEVPPPFNHECQWCSDCVEKMNGMRRAALAKAEGRS